MGYELDRIMTQYGMTSPSAVRPGIAPTAPTAITPNSEKQVADYNALLAKYNVDMPAYLAAKAQAEQAAAQNAAALKAGNMYAQSQFGYTGTPTAAAPAVAAVTPQAFTPLAPLAYLGSSLGTNAAGQRTADATQSGSGEASQSQSPFSADPNSVTGGLMGAALGFSSSPNADVGVSDLGQATYGNTGFGAAPGYGVGSMAGINSMDAMSDAYGQNSGTTGAMGGGFGDTGDSGDGGLGGTEGSGNSGGDNGADGGGSGGDSGGGSDGGGSDGGWARGGTVRRRFADGGLNDLAGKYDAAPEDLPMPAVTAQPEFSAPAAPMTPQSAPQFAGMPPGLGQMLSKYQGGESAYGAELKTAREAAARESGAFSKMLQGAMEQTGQVAPSKAEMYFRLASAFGAPTRTGHFTESLAAAGKTMGDYAKETREAERASKTGKLQMALEAQKLKMSGAKEDLNTLRTLAGEEMKDKRAVATKLLEQYIKSGEPESAAGKQAKDEGLKPGTPEFQTRVSKIAENNVDKQMAQINATLANVSVAQANQALAQQKFGFQQEQAHKLTAPEMKLKTDTEDMVAQTDQALVNLKKAYALNPNTFDASLVDVAQRKVLEAAGSKDPKVQNTREMENLLEKAALSSLKSTFPGAISNDERKALQDVQGLGAKSKEERAKIMKNGYSALKAVSERARKRLSEISSGVYRNTGEIDQGAE